MAVTNEPVCLSKDVQPIPQRNGKVSTRNTKGSQPPRTLKAKRRHPVWIWLSENQISLPMGMLATLLPLHILFPATRTYTNYFLSLSYHDPISNTYRQGQTDLIFLLGWVILFTLGRAVAIDWVFCPLARRIGVERKNEIRFSEQAWMALYYLVFWTLGMYIWTTSPYWLDLSQLWSVWPSGDMSAMFKWYYLVQFAFWVQQIVVIHIENPRKDHAQMLTHHIITCSLIAITYVYRYTRAANVILCLMDVVDLLLPIAKMLRYAGFENACNVMFGLFVATWVFARHYVYVLVCWHIYKDVPGTSTMEYGCYSGTTSERLNMPAQPDNGAHLLWPFLDPNDKICLNPVIKWTFLSMLLALQALSAVWFAMIIKVIVNMARGGKAEDSRSDDEGEDEDFEVEQVQRSSGTGASVLDVSVCASPGTSYATPSLDASAYNSTGRTPARPARQRLRLEDHKEILNRIGCVTKN